MTLKLIPRSSSPTIEIHPNQTTIWPCHPFCKFITINLASRPRSPALRDTIEKKGDHHYLSRIAGYQAHIAIIEW